MQDVCPSTRKNEHIYVRCLHEACVLLGGERHLAAYLNVTVEQVDDWLNGRGYPPDEVFLRCTDLLHQRAGPEG
jgi:hypothetical protein